MSWKNRQLNPVIGLDLGSRWTRIYVQGQTNFQGDSLKKEKVLEQPTVIATDVKTNKVLAVGSEAAEMAGRVKSPIKLTYPIQQGQVYDHLALRALLQVWLQELLGMKYLLSPTLMMSLPAETTQASREALIKVGYQLGAREVLTMAQPLAAAIGAGVPIADASGTLLFQLGAGVAEVGIISLGSLVESESSFLAGDYLEDLLEKLITGQVGSQKIKSGQGRQTVSQSQLLQNQEIGRETIKKIKEETSWFELGQQEKGQRRIIPHHPQNVEIELKPLAKGVLQTVAEYETLVSSILSRAYPELTADILDKGMLLSGGLANLVGLEQHLSQKFNLPVALVDDPSRVVIKGLATALENLSEFKQSFGQRESI